MISFCVLTSLIMSRHACAHMFLYLHVYILVCVWFRTCDDIPTCYPMHTVLVLIINSPRACSGVQSPTRGAFGSVGEVLEAAWPRCAPSFPLHGVPGTACTTGKPSLTMRLLTQPTSCLNRAGGCHVMLITHVQEGQLFHTQRKHTHTCRHTHTFPWDRLLEGLTHVRKMLQKREWRCEGSLRRWETSQTETSETSKIFSSFQNHRKHLSCFAVASWFTDNGM